MQSLHSLLARLRDLRRQLDEPSAYVSLAAVSAQKAEIEQDIAVLEDLIRAFASHCEPVEREPVEEAA